MAWNGLRETRCSLVVVVVVVRDARAMVGLGVVGSPVKGETMADVGVERCEEVEGV